MAVQTQLFHDRRQGPQKTVDDFAQDLQRLYSQAYAGVTRGTPEAEKVEQTVLASQFVAGLRPNLQDNIVGMVDQLVLKARFEEARSLILQARCSSRGGKPSHFLRFWW